LPWAENKDWVAFGFFRHLLLRGGSRAISTIKTLDLRRAKFALFKELLGGIPWARALEGRGVQECWSLFKRHFLHAQSGASP